MLSAQIQAVKKKTTLTANFTELKYGTGIIHS